VVTHHVLIAREADPMSEEDPSQQPGHITGVGGVFFRARDRHRLSAWYHEVLGLPVTDSATAKMGTTVWAAFDQKTYYFGSPRQTHMVNYRVDDLDAALRRLRGAGAAVAAEIDEDDYGRFAWGVDPEGNRFELWEPAPGR
jgi:predicted enzyme related to lactoylglutathione lyase